MLMSLAVLGAGLISESRCVSEAKKQHKKKTVHDEKNGPRLKTHFPCNSKHSHHSMVIFETSPKRVCRHFGNKVEAVGKALCCLLCPCVPSREQCSSEVQIPPAGRHSYIVRLKAGTSHYLQEKLLGGERNVDTVVMLLQLHFLVTSCRVLLNKEYYNNDLII